MIRRVWTTTVIATAALVAAPSAQPQSLQNLVLRNSFNPAGAGARGLGMGGAFIAVADDGTAASFNPAGLAQLRRTELAVVGFSTDLESTIAFAREGMADTETSTSSHGAPEFFGVAVPFDAGGRNLTLQLAYQRRIDLFGEGTAFISDTASFTDLGIDASGFASLVADVAPRQSGAFHTVSLSAGYQLTQRLSVGLGASYWVGEWTARGTSTARLLSIPPPPPAMELFRLETQFEQTQGFRGADVNVGVLLDYGWLRLGGVAQLPFDGSYDLEESTSTATTGGDDARGTEQRDFLARTRLRWPASAGLGVAIRPVTGLTLAVDITRANWSRMVIEQLPDGALLSSPGFDSSTGQTLQTFTDRNFFDLEPAALTVTPDTKQWRAGAEYLVQLSKLIVPLRAGVFRGRSPVVNLSTGDGREVDGWTIGAGASFSSIALDLAYQRRNSSGAIGLRLRSGQPVATGVPVEAVAENRFVASIIYRFSDDDPLKRFFRRIFVGPEDDAPDAGS